MWLGRGKQAQNRARDSAWERDRRRGETKRGERERWRGSEREIAFLFAAANGAQRKGSPWRWGRIGFMKRYFLYHWINCFFSSQGGKGSITYRKNVLCVCIPFLFMCTCCMHVHTDMSTNVCVCSCKEHQAKANGEFRMTWAGRATNSDFTRHLPSFVSTLMFIHFDIDFIYLMRIFPFIFPLASGSHPPFFVSGAFESNRGAHKNWGRGKYLQAQRQRGNREAV